VTLEDFRIFKDKFFRNLRFKLLVQGHLTEEEAKDLCGSTLGELTHKTINAEDAELFR